MEQRIAAFKENLEAKQNALVLAWMNKKRQWREALSDRGRQKQLDHAWNLRLNRYRERLKALRGTLFAIDPKNLLKKGYSIIFSEKEKSSYKFCAYVKKRR